MAQLLQDAAHETAEDALFYSFIFQIEPVYPGKIALPRMQRLTDSSVSCRRDDSYWNGNKKMPESEGRISQASDYSNRQQGRFNDFSSRDRARFPGTAPVQANNFDR